MKKYIALMLVFVMVLLAACNTAQPSTNTPTTTGSAATQGDSTTTPDGSTATEPGTTTTTPQETTKPPETTGGNSGTDATENTTIPTTNPTDPTNPSTTKPTDPTNPPSTKPTTPSDYTLKLNTSSISLSVGGTYTLSYTYTGSGALSWKTSNSDVASVTNGRVTAIAEGTAVISVSDGVKTSQCIVTVTKKTEVVYTLSLSPQTVTLNVGESKSLTASYNGNQSLSWTTSNSSVATVSNGKVTAKAAGTAVITVKAGNLNAQCVVTVNAPTPPPTQPVTLKINTANWTAISAGNTLQIDYIYTGNKSELTWSSSDTSVLTVDSNGVVTGKSAGSARVKVTNGSITKQIWIDVVDLPKSTSIKEQDHNAPLYDGVTKYAGDYMTFNAWALPDDSNTHVTVTSSNSSIVSVSYKLHETNSSITRITLNFKSVGSAIVTITSADGNVSKSYTINVKGGYGLGSGACSPEQFASTASQVMWANGMQNGASGWLQLTLSADELTYSKAIYVGQTFVHQMWVNGTRYAQCEYVGQDEDGNYVFHLCA